MKNHVKFVWSKDVIMDLLGILAILMVFGLAGAARGNKMGCNLPVDQRTEQQNEECGL